MRRLSLLANLFLIVIASTTLAGVRPVARWDVVPDQLIDAPFKAGVVAFHREGVKVEFRVNDKVVATAENPTLNETSGVWEFWFTLDPSQYPDGPIKVDAKAIPLSDQHPSYDLPPLNLFANSKKTLSNAQVIWVDAKAGADAGDGSEAKPVQTLAKAMSLATPGATVNLKPGSYESDKLNGGGKRPYWTVVQAAPGTPRDAVEVAAGKPSTTRIHWKDLTIFADKAEGNWFPILVGERGHVMWLDNCHVLNKKGRWAGGVNMSTAYTTFITGGVTSDISNGPGGSLIRGHTIERIASDAWTGSDKLVVNSVCIDIDRGTTEAHPDFHQSYAKAPNFVEDVILYNVRGYACKSQGLFGARLRNAAFVNVLFEQGDSAFLTQVSPPMQNVMYFHVNIIKQSWLWRGKPENPGDLSDVQAVNCIARNMSLFGGATIDGYRIDHNHFIETGLGADATTGDPGFVDPSKRDYHLKPDSPAAGTGVTMQCVPADIDGKAHPREKRNKGCYAAEK
jgi:hypothetical protein